MDEQSWTWRISLRQLSISMISFMNELLRNAMMENQASKDSGEAISVRIPIKSAVEGLAITHMDQHQWNLT
jgi:hypothetical protein